MFWFKKNKKVYVDYVIVYGHPCGDIHHHSYYNNLDIANDICDMLNSRDCVSGYDIPICYEVLEIGDFLNETNPP